jgi:hypothetical protein
LYRKTAHKALALRLTRKLTVDRIKAYIREASPEIINNISVTIADKLKKKEEEEDKRYSCWCFLLKE